MTIPADAKAYFDGLWSSDDPWALDTSEYDQRKYARELEMLGNRRYPRALEIGCGAGAFTRKLAAIADRVVAIDISDAAIDRARAVGAADTVEYRVADAVHFEAVAEGPWDLIVLSETIYYVGWRNTCFEVAWMAGQLFESARPGARLLMSNTHGTPGHYLQMKSLLDTYRDLFLHSGFELERSEVYAGPKSGAQLEATLAVMIKR
jgi:SAM-dependent methyltransferase